MKVRTRLSSDSQSQKDTFALSFFPPLVLYSFNKLSNTRYVSNGNFNTHVRETKKGSVEVQH